jgi:hypothetical protein
MTIDDPIRIIVTCTAVVAWLYFVLPRLPLLVARVFGPPVRLAIALASSLASYGVHVAMLCMASVSGYVLLTDQGVVYIVSEGTYTLIDTLVATYTCVYVVGASISVMCEDFALFCASQIGI